MTRNAIHRNGHAGVNIAGSTTNATLSDNAFLANAVGIRVVDGAAVLASANSLSVTGFQPIGFEQGSLAVFASYGDNIGSFFTTGSIVGATKR